MSSTFSAHSASAALMAADDVVRKSITWEPVNAEQRRFIGDFYQNCRIDVPDVPEITRSASLGAADINEESVRQGAKGQLKKIKSGSEYVPVCVSGTLDVLVKWDKAGNPEAIEMIRERDKFRFPAVRVGNVGLKFFSSENYPHTIVRLATQSEYEVYLTVADKILSGMELLAKSAELQDGLDWAHKSYSGVKFPMVDLRESPDISWFVGMTGPVGAVADMPYSDTVIRVEEALQENVLRIDEVGARVYSRTTMRMGLIGSMAEDMPPPPLVIEEPFYLWLVKPGCKLPLFSAYITEENWKKPRSLTDLSV